MNQPLISVVVPAFNEEKNIEHCLQALTAQDYPKDRYEIIVVDNGSTDNTAQIASKYSKMFSFAQAQGVSPARDFGFKKASGEIVASTDSDSVVSKDWLKSIAASFENPNLVGVGGRAVPLKSNLFIRALFFIYHLFLLLNQLFGKVLPWGLNFAVRKSAFEAIGGFNLSLKTSEDWDLSLRLQKKFGKESVKYKGDLVVFTSTRKQESPKIFAKYVWDGVGNYFNVVVLGKPRSSEIMSVR